MKAGWKETTLGKACELYQPQTITRKDMNAGGPYPVFGANGVIGRYKEFNHEERQLVLGCRGSVGAIHFTEPKSWITGNTMVVRPRLGDIDLEFLRYALLATNLADSISGTAQPQITRQSLSPVKLAHPTNIDEQRRVVAVLDKAFAGIGTSTANAQKNLTNARAASKRYLDMSFAECATRENLHKLSDIMEISHGFAFRGEDFSRSNDEAKPIVLTPGNYTENAGLDFSPSKTKRLANVPPVAFKFNVGDLTVVMTDLSSKMKILGKPAFIDRPDVLHNQRIGRVLFKTDAIDARLVYHFLRSEVPLRRIRDTATGTMVRHTAPSRILSNVIAVPRSAIKQTAMVARLDDMDENARQLETLYARKIAALSELKQSLLQKAFAGELT